MQVTSSGDLLDMEIALLDPTKSNNFDSSSDKIQKQYYFSNAASASTRLLCC